MATYDYDFFVIGAGSGGVRAARMASTYGAKVGIAEEQFLGGTCVNVGCIPKKLFSYGSHFAEEMEDGAAYGWDATLADPDWPRLIENKNREIERLNGIYRSILENNNVTLHEARATIVDAHTLQVGDETITADKILIATGGRPQTWDTPGFEHAITSEDAFYLEELPMRVMIAGGGYIAVEFAGIFNGYGADVELVYRGPLFLRGFDQDIRSHLAEQMVNKGITLTWNTVIDKVEKTETGLQVFLNDGTTREVDQLLLAIGRVPHTKGLGVENAGVEVNDKGAILVDENFKTSADNIYALGDVTDRVQLTPVAIQEAMVLTANLFDGKDYRMDYEDIATAVFSHPEVGTVGLTEEEARAEYGQLDIYKSTFRPLKHTLTLREERTMMKLIVDRASDRVVGAHMVGADAGEIAQGLGIAVKVGATKAQFDATMAIHPTASEEFVTMREPIPEPDQAQAAE